jgi:hypothetical protein
MPAGLPDQAKADAALEPEHEGHTLPSTREMPGTQADADIGEPAQESVAVPVQTAPPPMPYCVDEETAPRPMPYAADGGEEPAETHEKEKLQDAWRFWKGLFWTDAPRKAVSAPSRNTPADSKGTSSCREGRPDHEQAPACPCTGSTHTPTPRACKRRPPVRDSGEEESEEPPSQTKPCQPHLFQDAEGEEESPAHPEVDTMEFRPSDAHLSDWGPGPF